MKQMASITYDVIDGVIERIVGLFGFPEVGKHPNWLIDAVLASSDRRGYHRAEPRQHNPLLVQHWVDADTPHADILAWFDRQLDTAPLRPHLHLLDEQRMFLIDAPADEHQARSDSLSFAADTATLVVVRQGTHGEWYSDGRDTIRAAIPVHHLGLALVVNAAPPIVVLRHEEFTFAVQ